MTEIAARLTSKGQVTIPKAVREHLHVGTHDTLSFVIEDDGSVKLQAPRYPTVASLRGAAGTLPRTMTWDEMRDIAREDRFEQGAQGTR